MENNINYKGQERVYNLLGHTLARQCALEDMKKDLTTNVGVMGLIQFSVKKQISFLKNIDVVSYDDLNENVKIVPELTTSPHYYYYSKPKSYVKFFYSHYSSLPQTSNVYPIIQIERELYCFMRDFGLIFTIFDGVYQVKSRDIILHQRVVPKALWERYNDRILEQYDNLLKRIGYEYSKLNPGFKINP
jgi:hypothetical protein